MRALETSSSLLRHSLQLPQEMCLSKKLFVSCCHASLLWSLWTVRTGWQSLQCLHALECSCSITNYLRAFVGVGREMQDTRTHIRRSVQGKHTSAPLQMSSASPSPSHSGITSCFSQSQVRNMTYPVERIHACRRQRHLLLDAQSAFQSRLVHMHTCPLQPV